LADTGAEHAIEIHLDKLLADRGMTLTQLSEEVGVTIVNLSILKNGRAKAIRFSTLTALCEVLNCQPGDLMTWRSGGLRRPEPGPGGQPMWVKALCPHKNIAKGTIATYESEADGTAGTAQAEGAGGALRRARGQRLGELPNPGKGNFARVRARAKLPLPGLRAREGRGLVGRVGAVGRAAARCAMCD
jgi:putative transcriptional regulator